MYDPKKTFSKDFIRNNILKTQDMQAVLEKYIIDKYQN